MCDWGLRSWQVIQPDGAYQKLKYQFLMGLMVIIIYCGRARLCPNKNEDSVEMDTGSPTLYPGFVDDQQGVCSGEHSPL